MPTLQGSCARRPKNLRLFKAFSFNNSKPIQGLLPVDHSISIAYNPTGTWEKTHPICKSIRAWRLLIISGLSNYSTHLIATMAGSSHSHQVLLKVSHRQIPNFSRPSTRFPKQFKDFFSFMKFKDFSRLALNSRPVQEPWCWQHLLYQCKKWRNSNGGNLKLVLNTSWLTEISNFPSKCCFSQQKHNQTNEE